MADVSTPGTGPFQIIEHGPRDAAGRSTFAVVFMGDTWFTATSMRYVIAVAAALNAVTNRHGIAA